MLCPHDVRQRHTQARGYPQAKTALQSKTSVKVQAASVIGAALPRCLGTEGLLTLLSERVLGASSGSQGLLQEAPGQSLYLTEITLWALVGGGRQMGAWWVGLGLMGCCWSAVVCSPADAANQIDLVKFESCSRETVTHYSSSLDVL